ncbi:MAG: ABC transporter ATP-binding protein [Bacteroidaceae bacterium]|nr:ABC transporter ATP-binding protein [Bacteroidaceae bacterium]
MTHEQTSHRQDGNSPAFSLYHITTGYRSRHATHVVASDINATLPQGQLTCLLGPNGAGKSTLLRTLAAFQPPLAGEILLEGRPLASYTTQELATRIGIVLTERPNIQGMTVAELVAMGRSPYTGFWGQLHDDDLAQVEEAIRLVGIEKLRRRNVNTLSDGERQKVMIAKTLAQQTPIILLDEPTAFLDYPSKVEVLLLLRRLAHQMNKTIFLSTHDLELALQTADNLWLLAAGEPLLIGTPGELAESGALPRFFHGPGIEFVPQEKRFVVKKEKEAESSN